MESLNFKSGPLILMGSGETSPSSGSVFEEAARIFGNRLRIAILETPAGFELNSDRVAGRVGDFLKQRLQNFHPVIDVIPARRKGTDYGPDTPEILEPLYSADMIFLGPGSPTYTVRQLENSLAYEIIQARQRTGAALVLASAATLAFGCQVVPVYEIHKAGMDLHWQNGLNFLKAYGLDLIIVPHWNNAEGGAELDTSRCFMGESRFRTLLSLLNCEGNILGIDEHTSVWIDPDSQEARIFGKSSIHLFAGGIENVFSNGEKLPLSFLGEYKPLENAKEGIRKEIWSHLLWICEQQDEAKSVKPPADIEDMVHQREQARRDGDYSLADKIRSLMDASGWLVKDTPDGPFLEKKK